MAEGVIDQEGSGGRPEHQHEVVAALGERQDPCKARPVLLWGSCKQLPGQDHVGVNLTSHFHPHPRQLGLQPCPEAGGGGDRVEQLGEQLAAEGAHALLDTLRDLGSGVDRVLRVVLQVPAQILTILIRHGEEELSEGRLGQTVAAQVELDMMLTGGKAVPG